MVLLLKILFIISISIVQYINGECEKILDKDMMQGERDFIVYEHNRLRQMVANGLVKNQPPASEMKTMKYDMSLEEEAGKIATKCNFDFNNEKLKSYGANILRSKNIFQMSGAQWENTLQSWFSKHSLYHYGAPINEVTGEYTQMVWASTNRVGCNYIQARVKGDKYKYQKFYICLYSPMGNNGRMPYIRF